MDTERKGDLVDPGVAVGCALALEGLALLLGGQALGIEPVQFFFALCSASTFSLNETRGSSQTALRLCLANRPNPNETFLQFRTGSRIGIEP